MKLVFATNNAHKVQEIQAALPEFFTIVNLKDLQFFEEIPETHDTLEENASEKAWHIYKHFGLNCFADDTGLEIDALQGAPGVYSARYAGPGCSFHDNVVKVLREMENCSNRKARFRTIISLILNGIEYQFEGEVNGMISNKVIGSGGFGYDPIFIPDGYTSSFAEIPLSEKNKISHRGKAVQLLCEFLAANPQE
jgi:XTP/dITP diphosphohydrolase